MKRIFLISVIVISGISYIGAQNQEGESPDYLRLSWREVATRMAPGWYGSDEAKLVMENVLLTQKDIGGWAKNKPYHHPFSESEKANFIKDRSEIGATFDNGATITELRFVANVYAHLKDDRYKQAFEKGLDYILAAQYENGGWPQFYPVRTGKSVAYSGHITYNDDAMVNIMKFLRDIYSDDPAFSPLKVDPGRKTAVQEAFDRGIQCILNTQIIVDGQPTVWCAQHDEKTLAPAKARKYELESFSGSESVDIALLLMEIEDPSEAIIAAVEGAAKWFQDHKIEGIRLEKEKGDDGKQDLFVVEDKGAPPLWARFYDLETYKPFFCDRDGIKRNSIAEISYERRNGYGWYTDAPEKLLKKYPAWRKKNDRN